MASGFHTHAVVLTGLVRRLNGRTFLGRLVNGAQLISAPAALGFLGGKEIKDAGVGNLGLHDRECMQTQSTPTVHPLTWT